MDTQSVCRSTLLDKYNFLKDFLGKGWDLFVTHHFRLYTGGNESKFISHINTYMQSHKHRHMISLLSLLLPTRHTYIYTACSNWKFSNTNRLAVIENIKNCAEHRVWMWRRNIAQVTKIKKKGKEIASEDTERSQIKLWKRICQKRYSRRAPVN